MGRRIRIVLTLLLVGAAMDVMMAWGAVLLSEYIQPRATAWFGADPNRTGLSYGNDWIWNYGFESSRFGATIPISACEPVVFADSPTCWGVAQKLSPEKLNHAVTAGWPMFSLVGWITRNDEAKWGIEWRPDRQNGWPYDHLFPYRPIWPGVAVNTLLYAALLAILFHGPGFMRRRIRTWRGRCHRCGYPRGGSGTCPECGTALVAVSSANQPSPSQP